MNIKAFFVDALTSALDLGIGTPNDVLRHVTPEVLATQLPRPLWARLLTACLGAPRVDAQLVVDTIGVPNLCEHVPAPIIWACIAEIGARSLGKTPDIAVPPAPLQKSISGEIRSGVLAPPPDERPAAPTPVAGSPIAIGPNIPSPSATGASDQPLADLISELQEADANEPRMATLRPRSPTAQRFRQSGTGINRLTNRRPQAAAVPSASPSRPKREPTEAEAEDANGTKEIPVDDSQLVDWQATDGAGAPPVAVVDDDFSDLGRKR